MNEKIPYKSIKKNLKRPNTAKQISSVNESIQLKFNPKNDKIKSLLKNNSKVQKFNKNNPSLILKKNNNNDTTLETNNNELQMILYEPENNQ